MKLIAAFNWVSVMERAKAILINITANMSPYLAPLQGLLDSSDAHFAALYPPGSNHLEDISALTQPNVTIFGVLVGEALVACGAVKIMKADEGDEGDYGEIKRVFVNQAWRKHGFASMIMHRLHAHLWAHNLTIARLETGIHDTNTLKFYHRLGYIERPPFGEYALDPLSVFMEKRLITAP